uniref:hypothetical protein n=1 Tax=Fulvivirga sp. TaxID=1931237 RepID=UPI00404AA5E8
MNLKLSISIALFGLSLLNANGQETTSPYESFDTNSTIKLIGFYTNEESSDGEHSSGYFLHLWSLNGQLLGKLTFNEGLIGSGANEWLQGILSGDSIELQSTVYDNEITFKGIVSKTEVKGTFIWSNGKIDEQQYLKKCCEDAPIHKDYQNLSTFLEQWTELDEY